MTTPTPMERVAEQERSASSMATYPGRVVKADFARTLAVELSAAQEARQAAEALAESYKALLIEAQRECHEDEGLMARIDAAIAGEPK